MSAQHTPGPWFLPVENAGSAGTSVWARGGDVRVADCNSAGISLPGRQADARLIAAAPDLLAELERQIEREYNPFEPDNQSDAYTRMTALRARATGEAA